METTFERIQKIKGTDSSLGGTSASHHLIPTPALSDDSDWLYCVVRCVLACREGWSCAVAKRFDLFLHRVRLIRVGEIGSTARGSTQRYVVC